MHEACYERTHEDYISPWGHRRLPRGATTLPESLKEKLE